MTIGEKIKKLRTEKGWTQQRLADEIMAHKTAVANWEHRKYEPNIYNCIQLADVFDITLDELCCRSGKKGG